MEIYVVMFCVLSIGFVIGFLVAALLLESHLRSEVQRSFSLGEAAGRHSAEHLIPFPDRDRDPQRAA